MRQAYDYWQDQPGSPQTTRGEGAQSETRPPPTTEVPDQTGAGQRARSESEPSVSGGDKRPPRAAAQSLTDSAHSEANKAKDTCRNHVTERSSSQSRSPRAAPSRGPAQYGRPRGAPRIAPPLKDSHDRSVARSASQPTRRSSTAGREPLRKGRAAPLSLPGPCYAGPVEAPPPPTVQPADPRPEETSELRASRAAG